MVQGNAVKEQRIRDPVHGLIVFSANDSFDQLIWRLLNAREFQRLRRVKQLGFSELVYPGATHTRFSHSVGVFHTARSLVSTIRKIVGEEAFHEDRARIAVCAALLHDLGHGPFSHTFEGVTKGLGISKNHEAWTVEIIRGDTEVNSILVSSKDFPGLGERVAELLGQDQPTDIYASIVSSQFDADRLDYLRRDKLMTGTEHGGFDWAWLMNNLEVESITVGGDASQDPFDVDVLILGSKGLAAAEGYLLGRFHLYTQVYYHKTTRAAERMLGALLKQLAKVAKEDTNSTGLPKSHPLLKFLDAALTPKALDAYLKLDDAVIWGALPQMAMANDSVISELSTRILDRRLFKCLDVGAQALLKGGDSRAKFKKRLVDMRRAGKIAEGEVLEDETIASPYGVHEYESREALKKVIIRRSNGAHEDVRNVSPIVAALRDQQIYRLYAKDDTAEMKLNEISKEVGL